jgi:predicted type IV restriction endonuclease
MDFKDELKQLGEKVCKLKETVQTEEATKMAFIVPFIKALGYDVSDPAEVVPEYTCDVGIKKGEKIDYTILKKGEPIILIECKHWKQKLNLHNGQLLRYFHVSKAKFAILTNGIEYLFYSDLVAPNKMDEKPFLEVNFGRLNDEAIENVKKFHKSYFDLDIVSTVARDLKYKRELKAAIKYEIENPSENLVRVLAKQVYTGTINQKWLDFFTDLVKCSFSQIINEKNEDLLELAKEHNGKIVIDIQKEDNENEPELKLTEEETEGYKIVKAILSNYADRLYCINRSDYISIKLDGKKTICRLWLKASTKHIDIPIDGKRNRVEIKNVSDINLYADNLLKMVVKYEK